MSFYHLMLFLILFGTTSWAAVVEVPFNFTHNSGAKSGEKEEGRGSGRGMEGRTSINHPKAKVDSPTKSSVQTLRRLLKMMRKWWRSHPTEVKLGKCFASYFNIRIPGLRRYGDGYNDKSKERDKEEKPMMRREWRPTEIVDRRETRNLDHMSRISFIKNNYPNLIPKLFEISFISNIRNFLKGPIEKFQKFRDDFVSNRLLVCFFDYFSKKFWSWVDSAPDR